MIYILQRKYMHIKNSRCESILKSFIHWLSRYEPGYLGWASYPMLTDVWPYFQLVK